MKVKNNLNNKASLFGPRSIQKCKVLHKGDTLKKTKLLSLFDLTNYGVSH